jgi:hypothetical protein
MTACARCGSAVNENGFCRDTTCPFSDHQQNCTNGWFGHPDERLHPPYECVCHLVGPEIVLARTTFIVEVLHEVDAEDSVCSMGIDDVIRECLTGGWSMHSHALKTEYLDKEQAIEACNNQATDPGFFGIGQEDEADAVEEE